jgi:7-cyano-7-deazaguanine synthase in queuosine biosynthesis
MKPINIIPTIDGTDDYTIPDSPNYRIIRIPLDNGTVVSTNAWTAIRYHNIGLGPVRADFLRLAVAVYTSDQVISREIEGYQGWSRHIRLHFPVANALLWEGVRGNLEKMLSFLSGDRWEFIFRDVPASPVTPAGNAAGPAFTAVSLFSGGLDSLIGVINLLAAGNTVAMVSHHKMGSEHAAQVRLYKALRGHYGQAHMQWFDFYAQPDRDRENPLLDTEISSRARSFLFLALGLSIAGSVGPTVPLTVPENGLISLNVPLTDTRLSSHSTRTTHPHYFDLLAQVLQGLGIRNPIENPYQYMTKGEMMQGCNDQQFLSGIYTTSLSCSHADISRFRLGSHAGIHCGYCVPCIIRQSAELVHQGIQTGYANDVRNNPPGPDTGSGRDLRAFRMALQEIEGLQNHSLALRVLKSGPLPFNTPAELDLYVGVYSRGMAEVRNFLP